uniref:Charged multivesicular body protein 1a n=1 Tax=Hemiselmis tepida TaxID=464990 RepID=A0A7S0VMA6_9CRYP|mmetsp:Transcript_21473/g.54112  ORF Transcript_21473/g.54112 Transcript_21473/m.54112 type:complete len:210 (+) Transcript_21473:211-840(+)|eukprot:CAMPEP_0174926676 /NCGR_PEP_ID=MMETSP1355-20121228/13384_1 /TAXON_ID=464990 /ORGANISM="Hemiselmis tepida, Strain CCMP443" /LENGTH=209 /DNA_ID=CAMNT_0016172731 /DNA_START=61 /DNA_END=690 /DNA_ORIENTATION=-
MFGFGGNSSKKLEDELFNLKFFAKQLEREAKKSEKEEAKEKAKVKKEIEKGRGENAQIAAQNAILHKNLALNYLKTAARIDAVAGKLGAAIKMQKVTKSMGQITGTMSKVLASMDLAKIQTTMDQFEKAFDDTDVLAQTVTGTMESTTALSTPQQQIDDLMMQVAEEHQLDLGGVMPNAVRTQAQAAPAAAEEEEDELTKRLNALKAPE